MKIKPYYLIQSWSKRANKQQTQYLQTEIGAGKGCMNIQEAHNRSIEYAASLRESKVGGAVDWEPRVRLVNDSGNYLLDAEEILRTSPRTNY
tara:strand:+ start:4123 stop:4398 length:276 start_codon:yes stop_codon:yes gene_type:complete